MDFAVGDLLHGFLEQQLAEQQEVAVLGVHGLAGSPLVHTLRPELRLRLFQLLLHTSDWHVALIVPSRR